MNQITIPSITIDTPIPFTLNLRADAGVGCVFERRQDGGGSMNDEQIYWFARGYHDGRVVGAGVEEGLDAIDDAPNRVAYRQGYDCGVSDYCDLDARTGEAE